MSSWSEPFKKTQSYKTEDGRDYQITNTYVDLFSSRPFQPAEAGAPVLCRQLINVEVSGDLREDEALEILETIKKIHKMLQKQDFDA